MGNYSLYLFYKHGVDWNLSAAINKQEFRSTRLGILTTILMMIIEGEKVQDYASVQQGTTVSKSTIVWCLKTEKWYRRLGARLQ